MGGEGGGAKGGGARKCWSTDQVNVESKSVCGHVLLHSWPPHDERNTNVLVVRLPLLSLLVELAKVVACSQGGEKRTEGKGGRGAY